MSKRKPAPIANRRAKEEMNKRAIIWTGSVLLFIVIAMAVLLIFGK
ncbi:hypothetical protein B5M42_009605 [Paenibacillus athensensis]|nr:hypothetical protein [Paenibacillus athensensis]MCD1259092.1 hypothetical protein [Paenibacillus athensensis]